MTSTAPMVTVLSGHNAPCRQCRDLTCCYFETVSQLLGNETASGGNESRQEYLHVLLTMLMHMYSSALAACGYSNSMVALSVTPHASEQRTDGFPPSVLTHESKVDQKVVLQHKLCLTCVFINKCIAQACASC